VAHYVEGYCDLCKNETGDGDSFSVERGGHVAVFHYECGQQIHLALLKSHEADGRSYEAEVSDDWKQREAEERLKAVEEQVQRVTSVWRLWLNDAARGSINPGTFDAMKTLLGMK
jgi:hypothetical protein